MTHRVVFDREAEADLGDILDAIVARGGSSNVALGYVRRIIDQCLGLSEVPERGTRRDDLRPGLRTMGFERRVTIAFAVRPGEVVILRVLYGGRDLRAIATERPGSEGRSDDV